MLFKINHFTLQLDNPFINKITFDVGNIINEVGYCLSNFSKALFGFIKFGPDIGYQGIYLLLNHLT
ncbi:MAG: hypothetical protein GY839_10855 [candidate division Zixibacteria bacterium]|nr:hypothetical protein [candidate division Zixibacteria bacterium]